jgi:hypothetical protein
MMHQNRFALEPMKLRLVQAQSQTFGPGKHLVEQCDRLLGAAAAHIDLGNQPAYVLATGSAQERRKHRIPRTPARLGPAPSAPIAATTGLWRRVPEAHAPGPERSTWLRPEAREIDRFASVNQL